MASSANPYGVRNEQEDQKPPSHFDELPRDVQMEVLRRTAASFVVTFNYVEDSVVLRRYEVWNRFAFVTMIARYEFRLVRRRASGPEMLARFTRAL
jgi:hypothetical protein